MKHTKIDYILHSRSCDTYPARIVRDGWNVIVEYTTLPQNAHGFGTIREAKCFDNTGDYQVIKRTTTVKFEPL